MRDAPSEGGGGLYVRDQHMKRRLRIHRVASRLAKGLAAVLLTCAAAGVSAAAQAAEDAPELAQVTVETVAPASLPTFTDHDLEVRLYVYEPFLADVPARLLGVQRAPFSHTAGEATSQTLVLGGDTERAPRLQYYVTVFVLADGERTHIGEHNGEPGLIHVLTDGHPAQIRALLRPVRAAP